ncbi:MAG: hypothetical protein U0793_08460 [Gemmataceae bacterium]
MADDGNGQPIFRLSLFPGVPAQIRALDEQATARGIQDVFRAKLAEVNRRLQTNPREFGEPASYYANAKLMVRHAALAPVYVRYAVHQEQSVVFVLEVKLLGAES